MKVKIFDCESEDELEILVNNFISNVDFADIKYQVSSCIFGDEQIYCFSALIVYRDFI